VGYTVKVSNLPLLSCRVTFSPSPMSMIGAIMLTSVLPEIYRILG
jgi:hypothetical protein